MIDKKNLFLRVLTAIFGASTLLFCIRFGGLHGNQLLYLFLSLLMGLEFAGMALKRPFSRFFFLLGGLAYAAVLIYEPGQSIEWLSLLFLLSFVLQLLSARKPEAGSLADLLRDHSATLFGWLYVFLLPSYWIRIVEIEDGHRWIWLLLFMIWACDTGAYFAGQFFGKKKFYPAISPGKTWAGFYGGLACCSAVSIGLGRYYFPSFSISYFLVLGVIISLVAPIGDLCESFLKRASDRKDSGGLLPGHGGFLDRFDSVVFSLPVLYFLLRLTA